MVWCGLEGKQPKTMNVVRASSEVDISCEGNNGSNTSRLYSIGLGLITKRLKYVQWIRPNIFWIIIMKQEKGFYGLCVSLPDRKEHR